jgi:Lon protease-like protein
MAMNPVYVGASGLPAAIPVFPLAGALLLPRGELPLNIFEPRYLAMIDDALKAERIIGMIQPDEKKATMGMHPALQRVGCAGRITQLSETGDGRYLITLTGIARFKIAQELSVATPYRQCRVDYVFDQDFVPRAGEEDVDRDALLRTLKAFLEANKLEADWGDIRAAPTEALVNGLSMMSPYGPLEKQALLEAPDLRTRAETLIAVTEMALAQREGSETPLQ